MRALLRCLVAFALALTIGSHGIAEAHGAVFEARDAPDGFSELAAPHESVVDLYFGGRKVGETLAIARPGSIEFRSAADVLGKLPDVTASRELEAALGLELPTNSQAICSLSNSERCGIISPEIVGVIYDEDHFRADIFVNPRFLKTLHADPAGYLATPDAPLSLTSVVGLAASGTIGGSSTYNLQNRTIVAVRNLRIRANTSIASHLGLVVDDLVGEVDHKDLRYSGGLFWTPGNDFIGQRRIFGLGVGTQFDTWANQEELHGTPLIVFLAEPARIEILVDGRLVSSRSYPAGNIEIDTSALPSGSYSVVLRIHETGGAVREERRFFVKAAAVPPSAHPIFHAYGGALANTRRGRAVSLSDSFYYETGIAWRLSNSFAADVSLFGTQRKAILETGGWLLKGFARVRAAGLISSAGDAGALLQASSGGRGPLNISFDLRRIWSKDGRPLVPLSSHVETFGVTPPTGLALALGSYTQATASIGLRIGGGYLAVVGSYRKDRHAKPDYSIGPNVNWPLITRNRLQLVFEASAQHTSTSTAAFAGLRAVFNAGRMSVLGRVGQGYESDRDHEKASTSRMIGSLSAQYSYENAARTLFHAEGGLDREITSSTVYAGGTVESRLGNIRADLLHSLEGNGGTQYDAAYQFGIAAGSHGAAFGARDLDTSALVIALSGDATDAEFDVMVDDVARGRLKVGQRLSLFVPGYRSYKIRLVPTSAAPVSYDTVTREATLYPGNVRSFVWRVQSYFTIFAQAVSPAGVPIGNALVQSPKGIGETDGNGFFQLDVRRDDEATVRKSDGVKCRLRFPPVRPTNDFASLGKVICQ